MVTDLGARPRSPPSRVAVESPRSARAAPAFGDTTPPDPTGPPLPDRAGPVLALAGTVAVVALIVAGAALFARGEATAPGRILSPTSALPDDARIPAPFHTSIDTVAPVEGGVSLALLPDDRPVALFLTGESAVIVTCLDPSCASSVEHVALTFGGSGLVSDLKVAGDGMPVFAYSRIGRAGEEGDAGVVHCDDTECRAATVIAVTIGPGAGAPALAIAASGAPVAVVPQRQTPTRSAGFLVARCGGAACGDSTHSHVPGVGEAVAIAIDSADRPVLAVVRDDARARTSAVTLVACADPSCRSFTTDAAARGPRGRTGVSLALGTHDEPFVVFGAPHLQVVSCPDPSCTEPALATLSWDVDDSPAATWPSDGDPLVAYVTPGSGGARVLRIGACSGPTCSEGRTSVIDSGTTLGAPGLVLGRAGNPVVAYSLGGKLHIASCADPACSDRVRRTAWWNQDEFAATRQPAPLAAGWLRASGAGDGSAPIDATALTGTEDGLVAVGTTDGRPTAWLSTDGAAWTGHPIAERGVVRDVVANGSSVLAVGSTCAEGLRVECDPAIWVSTDGGSMWSRVVSDALTACVAPTGETVPHCRAWVETVTRVGVGYVAHGVEATGGAGSGRSLAWASNDGATWMPSSGRLDANPETLTADWFGGHYRFDATCSGDRARRICRFRAFVLEDGNRQSIDLDPSDFGGAGQSLIEDGLHLVGGDFGLVLIGYVRDARTGEDTQAMFRSTDGLRWNAFRLPAEMAAITDVARHEGCVVVADGSGIWLWAPAE